MAFAVAFKAKSLVSNPIPCHLYVVSNSHYSLINFFAGFDTLIMTGGLKLLMLSIYVVWYLLTLALSYFSFSPAETYADGL